MAQSSVAREPSMEEILASIRKIIESNEPGAGKSISETVPPVYEFSDEDVDDIRLTIDDDLAAAELNDLPPSTMVSPTQVDPRFVAANSAGPQRDQAPEVRSLSLADVAARVRAASERNAAQPSASQEAPPQRELPPGMAARFAEVRFSHEQSHPVAALVEEPAVAEHAAPDVVAHEEPTTEPAMTASEPEAPEAAAPAAVHHFEAVVVPMRPVEVSPEPETQTVQPQQPAAMQSEPETAPAYVEFAAPRPTFVEAPQSQPEPVAQRETESRFLPQIQEEVQRTLLSAAAGEQVARSFDELAAALGQEHRTLDEIAEDMLRPMLQEWLDDNLPTLVERLVREEIERVARGPRR